MAGTELEFTRSEDDPACASSSPRATLDLLTARELGDVLRAEVAEQPEEVVVDLTETTHLDSTGIAVLLNAQRSLTRAGSRFAVGAPAGAARRVLELTGVAETLHLSRGLDRGRLLGPRRRLRRLRRLLGPGQRRAGPRTGAGGPRRWSRRRAGCLLGEHDRRLPAHSSIRSRSGGSTSPASMSLLGWGSLVERLPVGACGSSPNGSPSGTPAVADPRAGRRVRPTASGRLSDGVVQPSDEGPGRALRGPAADHVPFPCGASFPVRVPGTFFDSTPGEKVRSLIDQPPRGNERSWKKSRKRASGPRRIRRRPVGEGRSRSGRQRGRAHRR